MRRSAGSNDSVEAPGDGSFTVRRLFEGSYPVRDLATGDFSEFGLAAARLGPAWSRSARGRRGEGLSWMLPARSRGVYLLLVCRQAPVGLACFCSICCDSWEQEAERAFQSHAPLCLLYNPNPHSRSMNPHSHVCFIPRPARVLWLLQPATWSSRFGT